MKKVLVMPIVVVLLSAAACGGDSDPTPPTQTARVRFLNATTGMTGSGGFTTNGQFVTGSVLAFGQSTPTCATVNAGSTSFGFGASNTGGTGLSGNALATLSNQSMTVGGNFAVVAMGSATSPTLFLLDNTFAGSLGTNQTAVRFVNLAPGTANPFTVFTGVLGAGGTITASNIAVGSPTTFNTVASGSNAFTVLNGHDIVISGGAATLNLQGGTVNTIAIVPNTSDGFQLINLPRC